MKVIYIIQVEAPIFKFRKLQTIQKFNFKKLCQSKHKQFQKKQKHPTPENRYILK